jgi:hypothetical protein
MDAAFDSSDSSMCGTCSSPLAPRGEYCLHCGSKRVDGGDLLQPIAPVPIGATSRKQSVSPSAQVMLKLFSKSQECSQRDLLGVAAAVPRPSSPGRRLPWPHRKKEREPSLNATDVMAAVTALQDEVRSLREDLREETKARFKVEALLVRCVEDLMRLRGGVSITEDLLEKKLRVATNFLDQLAPRWKLDYDAIDFGDLIASGGFSDVYGGTYANDKVAIKKLRIDVLDPDDYFLELEKEVQLMSELSHPNVLKLIGVCVWPSYYILTEFMAGGTLAHALADTSGVAMNWSVKQHILLQIACAFHYLHHLEPVVVHLDLVSWEFLCFFSHFSLF